MQQGYNFRQVSGSTKFLSYKEWQVNEFVVGEIQSFRPNAKNPKFQDVVVKVMESNLSKLPLKKDEVFTINGTTSLQKGLDTGAEEGDILKVVFKGKEKVKTGQWAGAMTNVLEVFLAPNTKNSSVEATTEGEDIL